MMDKIGEVKKKREYSKMPSSIVKRALDISKQDVKASRAFLRKYFGVFLTNRVLKAKGSFADNLSSHKSSQLRDYNAFYTQIQKRIGKIDAIIDLGAGFNGYSYPFIEKIFGKVNYRGLEAIGQIVESTNNFFKDNDYLDAVMTQADLLDLKDTLELAKNTNGKKVAFLLQVVDALEGLENNYSKKLIEGLMQYVDFMVISLPTQSIGSKRRFIVDRKWLINFLEERFNIIGDYNESFERVLIIGQKS